MNKTRELAKAMRELADLYDKLADIEESEERQDEQELENLLGRILMKSLMIKQLS